MAWMTMMKPYLWRLACLILIIAPAGQGLAASCTVTPVRAAGLQRQIAANLSFQARHDCGTAGAAFACREIAARISATRASLAALSPACDADALVPARRTADKPLRREMSARLPQAGRVGVPAVSAKIETMCVRLSDGYYFPTPNSGFKAAGSTEALTAQCRSICDDPQMEVFRRTSAGGLSEDMVSLVSGTRYGDLPNAGAYRQAASARTCDMARFYKTVMQGTATGPDAGAPTQAMTVVATLAAQVPATLFANVGLRGSQSVAPAPPRRIRKVGLSYLPDE